MDIKRKEEIEDIVRDVADGKLDEGDGIEQIIQVIEEYADERLVSHLEKQNQNTD